MRCAFDGCDLGGLEVPGSTFSGCSFERCQLVGINWTEAAWPKVRLWPALAFRSCVLNHSTMIGLGLSGLQAIGCIARNVDWRQADLSDADLAGTDLSQSLFGHTNLSRANLAGARNYRIRPGENTLTGARFALPEALALLEGLDIVIVPPDDALDEGIK